MAIHTWPEYGFAAVDLFTCGIDNKPHLAVEVLKRELQAGRASSVEMRRGQPDMLTERRPPAPDQSSTSTASE